MPTRTRRGARWAIVILIGAALIAPATASANAFSRLQDAYTRSADGTIDPCAFSTATLRAALGEAPSYDFQYGADLSAAIRAALVQRDDGACRGTHPTRRGASAGAHLSGPTPRLPDSATAGTGAGLPAVLVALLVVVGLGLLIGAGWGAWWWLGLDPAGLRAARHAISEAELRVGAGWEHLVDRLRR